MTSEPLVTIVLQTYNRRQMLEDALNSAREQTYKNIEILIGDNHSEGGTEEFCTEQAKLDSRIKYFRHPENIGMVGNANFLLDRVEGEYFIFLNDDDWLDLDYVEKSIMFIHGKDDYSMVCPSTVLYKDRENTSKTKKQKCKIVRLNNSEPLKRLREYIRYQDLIEMSTGCFRSSILKDIKKAEGQYLIDRYNEDIVLEMKFLAAGKCKMLANTHLNKRDGGYSRDLSSVNMVYTAKGITMNNILKKRREIFTNAVKNDKYFSFVLGEKNAKILSKKLYNALSFDYKLGIYSLIILWYRILATIVLIRYYKKILS